MPGECGVGVLFLRQNSGWIKYGSVGSNSRGRDSLEGKSKSPLFPMVTNDVHYK